VRRGSRKDGSLTLDSADRAAVCSDQPWLRLGHRLRRERSIDSDREEAASRRDRSPDPWRGRALPGLPGGGHDVQGSEARFSEKRFQVSRGVATSSPASQLGSSALSRVTNGVPNPKQHPGPMPPLGGAQRTPEQVRAVAAYVYSLSHPTK
jgi:hypothetical protein